MKKIPNFNEAGWLAATLMLSMGVCFMTKAGFGISMIVSPAYVIHIAISKHFPWYTFGMSEYVLQGIMLVVMCLIVRRFKWQYLLSFADAVFYGLVLDTWFLIFGRAQYDQMHVRVIMYIVGEILSGFSVALYFRTYMPIEVYDLLVTEITDRYKFKSGAVKWVYDLSMLAFAVALTFVFNGGLVGIGWGTLICAAVNAPIIMLCGRIEDAIFTFEPLFPKLYKVVAGKPYGEEEIV